MATSRHEETNPNVQLERTISQAFDEGHDADIPSAEGYVLDEAGENNRRASLNERRKKIEARGEGAHRQSTDSTKVHDVEKGDGPQTDDWTDDTPSTRHIPATATVAAAADDDDPNVVWWDGDDDPEHPFNWPSWKTFSNIALISGLTFISPLASSLFAPGVPQLMKEFGNSNLAMASFVVSVYVLGFAFGPLVMAPLSEIYGRVPIFHACNVGFVAFLVACALAPSINSLIAFRFLSGLFGSCAITNGGGSIADMVTQEKRAKAMAGFVIGLSVLRESLHDTYFWKLLTLDDGSPLLGPIIGPVIGGFLSDAKGWRWTFWLLAILAGSMSVVMLFSLRESYHPTILQRKTERLRKETGNQLLRSKLDIGLSKADFFKRSIIRPLKLIAKSPITIIMSLYVAVVYGYLYLMFTSMTMVFEQYYGFRTQIVGLAFIGLGVGSLIGVACFSSTSDRYIQKKAAEEGISTATTGALNMGTVKPEHRLPLLPIGAIILPAGLFMYGWTAEYHLHWIVPIIGTGIIGIGNIIIMMCIQMYLIDAFTIYAASAIAANTLIRSTAGAVLPLAGLPMYDKLGMGWGNSVLGFIAVALIPVAFLVIRYGEFLRKKFEVKDL